MNDFTKEELQSLKFHVDTSLAQDDDTENLMVKIQSLIDNYPKCDHRSGLWFYNESGERFEYDTGIYRCRHCDILFKNLFENGVCISTQELK